MTLRSQRGRSKRPGDGGGACALLTGLLSTLPCSMAGSSMGRQRTSQDFHLSHNLLARLYTAGKWESEMDFVLKAPTARRRPWKQKMDILSLMLLSSFAFLLTFPHASKSGCKCVSLRGVLTGL